METITIQIPATPTIMKFLGPLLQQEGVSVQKSAPASTKQHRVTLKEGAKIAGVHYVTFYDWVVVQDKIPYSRPSGKQHGRIKVLVADIEKLLDGKMARKTPGRKGREVPII